MDFKEGVGAMIEKYFNGVIEQVYHRIGNAEKNIVMASYNNDFSVSGLENKKRYQEDDNVFFACCELQYETLSGAYAPFLDIICDMFRKFVKGDFEAFLRECGTYELHRSLFLGYYEDGICKREEGVLLNEVEYEQRRMTEAIVAMLKKLTEYRPIMIVINRFQLAGRKFHGTYLPAADRTVYGNRDCAWSKRNAAAAGYGRQHVGCNRGKT